LIRNVARQAMVNVGHVLRGSGSAVLMHC